MRDDLQVRRDVEAELDWDPRFDSRDIGVAVKNGVVTLTGQVTSFAARGAAQSAAGRVARVKAVANEIEIRLATDGARTDTDLAEVAVHALASHVSVSARDLQVMVQDGWITLDGWVASAYQRHAAESALRHLRGVRGISNKIAVRPSAAIADIKSKIDDAFRRHTRIDAEKVHVGVLDNTVTLTGEVSNWQ